MLKNKRLFLFDIDGTLSVEDFLYDGSLKLLELIKERGGYSFFITNNSTKSCADYVEKFKRWNIETEEKQFVTAGFMTREFLKEKHAKDRIFVVGTKSFIKELRKNKLNVTTKPEDDVKCVLVAYDSELKYDKLVDACEILSREDIEYYATNPDMACPAKFGFIPDCGAICKMLEYATKRVPVYIGKPSAEVVNCCMRTAGITSKDEVLVVGDRLYTDIACGINAGVETCVVYTGEAKPSDIAETEWKPDYCFNNIKDLYEAFHKSLG